MNADSASLIVEAAADTICSSPASFADMLDDIPAPLYVTDAEGTLTYFNKACVPLAGRTPAVGRDKWCVTWRIYTTDGEYLPHDMCPMAVTIREQRPVRNVEAIAARPDGTQVRFIPYPTPLFDGEGNFSGAVNLLLEVSEQRKPEFLREQAERCRRLAAVCADAGMGETLQLMAAKYDEHSIRSGRVEAADKLPH
jgi:PAS domain-containing protein